MPMIESTLPNQLNNDLVLKAGIPALIKSLNDVSLQHSYFNGRIILKEGCCRSLELLALEIINKSGWKRIKN
jgi:hypothetical protein